MENGLMLEKKEYVLLKRFLNLYGYHTGKTLGSSIEKLIGALESAVIHDEADMPKDVVRFHSMVTIGQEGGWQKRFQLVLPNNRNAGGDKISILSPLGTALIGNAKGAVLKWGIPIGERHVTITEVIQMDTPIDASILW